MKSLEMVNANIKQHLERIKYSAKAAKRKPYYYEPSRFFFFEKDIEIAEKELEDLLIIKQDLDVLEIIKNKSVYLRELKHILQGFREKIYTTMEEVLVGYNLYVTRENELTLEELLKLKQWLEEQNERD